MPSECGREFSTVAEFEMYGPLCAPIHGCIRPANHDTALPCHCRCGTSDDNRSATEMLIELIGTYAFAGILIGTAIRVGHKLARTVRARKGKK